MAAQPLLRLESTGNPALDRILGGGIPGQSVTVIAGEPGAGKTIFTLQMLFAAAREGKKCLYFTTLSEPAIKVIRYMQSFDFFDVEILDKLIIFADLGKVLREGSDATIAEIVARVETLEPDYVAIDSFRSIVELMPQPGIARSFVYDLANHMAGWGATTFLVGEYVRDDFSQFAEFAVADGIIRLGVERQDLTSVRTIEIMKLRGGNYISGRHFFEIGPGGLYVYPRVRAPEFSGRAPSLSERDSTGVAGLDELLDGGLPRGSCTVVQGGTGAGKTILSLNFLLAGIARNEKGLLFTLEETPDQLREIAKGLGWDLDAQEKKGMLVIRYASPVELMTDRFFDSAREDVQRLGARRAVLDSLTTISLGVPSERRFKELIYSTAKHLRSVGCSAFMTMESEQLLGNVNLSGLGVSFMADNLMQIRYVELDGRLERAVSVIKARGINLNTELRSAVIGKGGIKVVGERFKDLRGVLTGLPSRTTR
ncbi:MAG TPA: ATPase domain-containing protein [Polyangia bacterium]|nr:ATPase domain-containing protein [Polyangia bacterium]